MENKIQIQQPLVVDTVKKKDNKRNKGNKNSNINIKKI